MLKHLLMAMIAIFVAAAAPAEQTGPGSPDAFTRRMLERFNREIPDAGLEISEPLQLRRARDRVTVNLDRIYNYCRANPAADCEVSTASFVASIRESFANQNAPIRREQLRLMVRGADYCEEVRRVGADATPAQELAAAMRPVGPGLCAVLVTDYPRTMRITTPADLTTLSLAVPEAWALAERQTLATFEGMLDTPELANGLVVFAEADYIPSLMLAHDGWRRAVARHGELIVAVPADGVVIALRRADARDLPGLRTAVRDHYSSAERGISTSLYRWTEAGWERIS